MKADDYLTYDVHGMDGTRYQQNRVFNAVYGRCMRAQGYRPRPYSKNLLAGLKEPARTSRARATFLTP